MKNFSNYQYRKIITEEGTIADGDYIISEKIIVRIKNGYLNDTTDEAGKVMPAIETMDNTHIEHWRNGLLNCDFEPAVIDFVDGYEEWWNEGHLVKKELNK